MIDIRLNEIIDELKRFGFNEKTDGVLNLDFCVLFPYSNTEVVTFRFALLNDDIVDQIGSDLSVADSMDTLAVTDITANHRYPNRAYVTYSKKVGRKICKTGYPIFGPVEELNEYRMLLLEFGIKDQVVYFGFPISVDLTSDKPVGGLDMKIYNFEDTSDMSEFGIRFCSCEGFKENDPGFDESCRGVTSGYFEDHYYYLGTFKNVGVKKLTKLTMKCYDKNSSVIGYEPQIKIYSNPLDHFML